MDLIDRQELLKKAIPKNPDAKFHCVDVKDIESMPSAEPEIIRCKDCKHQEKFFHTDGRRKGGGYYIYGCDFAEEYSHVCLDDDFCSRAERRTDE